MRYFLKLLMVVAALFLNVGLGFAFELVPKDGESIYCIGNKGDDSKYFGHPKVFTAFSISDEEISKRSKTPCKFETLSQEKINEMLANGKGLLGSYVGYSNEYEIGNNGYELRISIISSRFAVDWLELKEKYEELEEECGFRGFSKEYNLMEINYHGQTKCSGTFPSQYFGGIVKTDDGGELLAICWIEAENKNCSMTLFFKDWQFSVSDIPGGIIGEWSSIRKAVLADLENKLLIYYVAPDICVGDVCEEFLKGIDS